jgi:hypothetical protein
MSESGQVRGNEFIRKVAKLAKEQGMVSRVDAA